MFILLTFIKQILAALFQVAAPNKNTRVVGVQTVRRLTLHGGGPRLTLP